VRHCGSKTSKSILITFWKVRVLKGENRADNIEEPKTTVQPDRKNMMTDEEAVQKLEESTKNAQRHQLETLRSILLHNGTVRYLQSFIAKGDPLPLDPPTFKRVVPLSSYEDYVDYINQMADGNQDPHHPLLSVDPLLCFFYRYTKPPSSSFSLQITSHHPSSLVTVMIL